jgi:hypothetical protein
MKHSVTLADEFTVVTGPVNVNVDVFSKFLHVRFTLTVGLAMGDHPSDGFRLVTQLRFNQLFIADIFSDFSVTMNFF